MIFIGLIMAICKKSDYMTALELILLSSTQRGINESVKPRPVPFPERDLIYNQIIPVDYFIVIYSAEYFLNLRCLFAFYQLQFLV